MHADIARWKYFDNVSMADRERGFALVHGEDVAGFIGLIPVEFSNGSRSIHGCWACDWSVSHTVRGAYGLQLLNAAQRSSDATVALGGADVTRKILSRISPTCDGSAGLVFRKHVTLSGIAMALKRRGVLPASLQLGSLNRFPIPRFRSYRNAVNVSQGLEHIRHDSLSAISSEGKFQPSYTHADLEWRLLRCPGLETWSCETRHSEASALAWRSRETPEEWKAALLVSAGSEEAISDCIECCLRLIEHQGGGSVNTLVSRVDKAIISSLAHAGFRRLDFEYPLYNLTSASSQINTVARLSYLDSDIYYRFA